MFVRQAVHVCKSQERSTIMQNVLDPAVCCRDKCLVFTKSPSDAYEVKRVSGFTCVIYVTTAGTVNVET